MVGSSWLLAVVGAALLLAPVSITCGGYVATDLYTLSPRTGYTSAEVTPGPWHSIVNGQAVGYAQHLINSKYQDFRAQVWNGATPVDLSPASSTGFVNSFVDATNGSQQVGYAQLSQTSGLGDTSSRAMLWNGTAGSAVNLHPANFDASYATATSGTQQVGWGTHVGGVINALLWTGTAASVVNLGPTDLTGVDSSYAIDTDGAHQVGYGNGSGTGVHFHALLWSGTGASAVDLHPTALATLLDSQALGVGGGQEVGLGTTAGLLNHALLWTGSAASAVDLQPITGFGSSQAQATNGKQQVGWGVTSSGATHALLWNGTAASAVDLHDALPAGFSKSYASSIDAAGDVFGLALDSSGNYHAIEWAVPEPSSLCLAILASPLILLRQRRVADC